MENQQENKTKDMKSYLKSYYEKNKDHLKKQITICAKNRALLNLIEHLNTPNYYKRLPFAKIEKYNIKKDENGKYYI